jgi:hypothetical protein
VNGSILCSPVASGHPIHVFAFPFFRPGLKAVRDRLLALERLRKDVLIWNFSVGWGVCVGEGEGDI